MQMNMTFLMSCAAVTILGLGGAATPTNAEARQLNFGTFAGRGAVSVGSHTAPSAAVRKGDKLSLSTTLTNRTFDKRKGR
jgi:hypothetical protein